MPTRSGWTRSLSHPITLKDGTVLVTLLDARSLIQQRFPGIAAWQPAINAMVKAAESGDAHHILLATMIVERMLSAGHLL